MEAVAAARAHLMFGMGWFGVGVWREGSLFFDPGESEVVAGF